MAEEQALNDKQINRYSRIYSNPNTQYFQTSIGNLKKEDNSLKSEKEMEGHLNPLFHYL